jgi:hypothetical protein
MSGGQAFVDITMSLGRPIKIVSIVDEHTRECLGGLVEPTSPDDT